MSQHYSQARLTLEANVAQDGLCAQWCIGKGLLRRMEPCTIHGQDRVLAGRQDRAQLFWRCNRCKDQIALRAGSIFEQVKLPLGRILLLLLSYAQDLSVEEAREACTYAEGMELPAATTVVRLYARLRALIAQFIRDQRMIGGPGVVVQIDEALIGRRKHNVGRVPRGTWVLGMIAEDGAARFEIVQDRSAPILQEVILRNVAQGSVLHTDEWRSYSRLSTLGYTHATVNHSKRFVSPDGVHTQRIEAQWRAIRRKFSRGGIHHKDIQDYLCEYIWRRSCRSHTHTFISLIDILQV